MLPTSPVIRMQSRLMGTTMLAEQMVEFDVDEEELRIDHETEEAEHEINSIQRAIGLVKNIARLVSVATL